MHVSSTGRSQEKLAASSSGREDHKCVSSRPRPADRDVAFLGLWLFRVWHDQSLAMSENMLYLRCRNTMFLALPQVCVFPLKTRKIALRHPESPLQCPERIPVWLR